MADISDVDSDDFVPFQHKRRRVVASQPVRKQKFGASQKSTPSQTPSGVVQGALLPKASACQPIGRSSQCGKHDGRRAQPAINNPLSAMRTPLRTLPAGSATAGPHATARTAAVTSIGAVRSSGSAWEAPSGVSAPNGLSRLISTPAPPATAAAPPNSTASGAALVTLPGASAPSCALAGPWRRHSEPRPTSRLASRRSDRASPQCFNPQAQQQQQDYYHPQETQHTAAALAPASASHSAAATVQLDGWSGAAVATPQRPDPAATCCPVCGCDLALVSDTATGREAHVNACLDSGSAEPQQAARVALLGKTGEGRTDGVVRVGSGAAPLGDGATRRSSDRPTPGRPSLDLNAEPPEVVAVCVAHALVSGCRSGGGGGCAGTAATPAENDDEAVNQSAAMEIELLESDDEGSGAQALADAAQVGTTAAAVGGIIVLEAEVAGHGALVALRDAVGTKGNGEGGGGDREAAHDEGQQEALAQERVQWASGMEDGAGDHAAVAVDADDDDDDGDFFWPLATQVPPPAGSPSRNRECQHLAAHAIVHSHAADSSALRTANVHPEAGALQVPDAEGSGAHPVPPTARWESLGDARKLPPSPPEAGASPCGDDVDLDLAWRGDVGSRHAGGCNGGAGGSTCGFDVQPDAEAATFGGDAGGDCSPRAGPGLQCDADALQYDDQPSQYGDGQELCEHEEAYDMEYPAEEPEEPADPEPGEDEAEDVDEDDPVAAWLSRHGLQRWLTRFRDGEVDESVLPELNDSDLQGLAVDSPRARAAILLAARDFGSAAPQALQSCWVSPPAPTRQGHPVGVPHPAGGAVPPTAQPSGPENNAHYHQGQHHQQEKSNHPLQHQQPQTKQPDQQRQPCTTREEQTGCVPSSARRPQVQVQVPPSAGSGAGPVQAAQPAQPFASMFLAKPAGPVRITSFFRGTGGGDSNGGGGPQGPVGGPQPAHHGHRNPHERQQQPQPHPAFVVLDGQAGPRQRPPPPPAVRQQQQQQRPQPGAAGSGPAGRLPRWVPECHTIPGTRFLVDYFGPPSKNVPATVSPFRILTHFHADHYKGLTRSFNGGTVLASPVTARLVSERLKLPAARLRVLPMDTPVDVDGVSLTLVDANHCPGAAMVVAQPPGGWPPVLHTGDCRLGEHMRSHPALQALVGRRCTLVLDTTYCDPQYEFPPQRAVLDAVMEAVKAESFNKRALFVFGTYTIGKERLFLEVAAALGQKVYCSKEKAATLAACGLAPQYASLITTSHLEASIHAVPLFKVTLDGLSAILQQYRGRYSAVIGFSPTGWNHTGGPRGGGGGRGGGGAGRGRGGGGVLSRQQQSAVIGRRVAKGTAVVYQVPYSEHSSFGELRSFVSWLQPGRIVPSVNADGPAGPKTRRMLELLLGPEQAAGAGRGGSAQGGPGGGGGGGNGQAAKRDIRSFMRGTGGGSGGSGAGVSG